MNNKFLIKLISVAALGFLVAACSNKTKDTLGLTQKIPDEFQVSRSQGLEVPPHYNLPEPKKTDLDKKTDLSE